jgi:HSP20 family protein
MTASAAAACASELDRLVDRVWGTAAHPVGMPMDAWREGDTFFAELDLPGVHPDSIDLDVERNVLTVKAERKPTYGDDTDTVITERPAGTSSRQLFLGDTLDTEKTDASYDAGVLKLRIPVAAGQAAQDRRQRRKRPQGTQQLTDQPLHPGPRAAARGPAVVRVSGGCAATGTAVPAFRRRTPSSRWHRSGSGSTRPVPPLRTRSAPD